MLQEESKSTTFRSELGSGTHVMKLIFFKFSSASSVTVKSIEVIGTEKTNTGGLRCSKCPPSHIQTQSGQSLCTPCPFGHSADESRTQCLPCKDGFYTPIAGSDCLKCPLNSFATSDKSSCIPDEHVVAISAVDERPFLYHSNFFSSILSERSSTSPNNMHYQLCATQGAFCQHGFFGPDMESVEVNKTWYLQNFYFSPQYPSDFKKMYDLKFERDEQEERTFKGNSYLVALFDTQMVSQLESQMVRDSADSSGDTCSLGIKARNQKVVKSLGSQISSINARHNGYIIQYHAGDKCFYKNNLVEFSSEIRFVCDHFEDEGWPMLLSKDMLRDRNETGAFTLSPCHLVFEWRSKYACRQCLNSEVTQIQGSCIWNKRVVTQLPSNDCNIYRADFINHMLMDPLLSAETRAAVKPEIFAYERISEEACSPMDDFLRNKTVLAVIVVLFIVLTVIFLCCSLAFCRYRKMKYQYYSKVKLLSGGRGSGSQKHTGESRSDVSNEQEDSSRNQKKGAAKKQIIYKIGDEDE